MLDLLLDVRSTSDGRLSCHLRAKECVRLETFWLQALQFLKMTSSPEADVDKKVCRQYVVSVPKPHLLRAFFSRCLLLLG